MLKSIRRALLWGLLFALSLNFAQAEIFNDTNARFRGIPSLEVDGRTYRLNRHMTTLLLIGVDQTDAQAQASAYRSGGQADFLALVAVDDARKRISVIQINRDTIVDMTVLNVLGEATGTRSGQICLSHAFGDGAERSCELTVDAVSALLNDTPIDNYIAMNMDGIAALNDALGGVSVTLEDDFTAFDPEMRAGTTLTLRGRQAEYYVRARYSVGDQSNAARLVRQRAYIDAAADRLREGMGQGRSYIEKVYASVEPYLVSSISRGALFNIADKAGRYTLQPILELTGTNRVGESGFMEFHPDESALRELIASVLYEPVDP